MSSFEQLSWHPPTVNIFLIQTTGLPSSLTCNVCHAVWIHSNPLHSIRFSSLTRGSRLVLLQTSAMRGAASLEGLKLPGALPSAPPAKRSQCSRRLRPVMQCIQSRDATFSPIPITGSAPHHQIANNYRRYRLTKSHYRQIAGINMAFNIQDGYYYRRVTDKAGLFTTDNRR